MKKLFVFSLVFMLLFSAGFVFSSGVNAQILMVDENVSVKLNSNDKIIYQKEIETDSDKLYVMANKRIAGDQNVNSALVKSQTGTSTIYNNIHNIDIDSKCYLQHYLTIQRESGAIEKYYCLDSFTDVPSSILNENVTRGDTSEGEIVTPGVGAYDSTYSARGWAKIHYVEGYRSTNSSYMEYIKALWYRGTVYQVDSSVTVTNRRIWCRNIGFNIENRVYQDVASGPHYAPSGSNTVTVNKPSNFYTLLTDPLLLYELRCTCQADISRGNNTWYLQTTIRKTDDGIGY